MQWIGWRYRPRRGHSLLEARVRRQILDKHTGDSLNAHSIQGVSRKGHRGFQGKSSDDFSHASGPCEPGGGQLVQVRGRAGGDTGQGHPGAECRAGVVPSQPRSHTPAAPCVWFPESRWIPCPPFLQMLSSEERWEGGNVPDGCVGKVGIQSGRGPWGEGPWVCRFRELDPGPSLASPCQMLVLSHGSNNLGHTAVLGGVS